MLSAAFIMAANAWMQHPVGYTTDADTGRPVLNSIGELFTNPVFIWGYIHVILAALVTGAVVMLAVSAWQLRRGKPHVQDLRAALARGRCCRRRCCSWAWAASSASSRRPTSP